MKQFIVDRHTTPNTPTLEQVPTEKIPVYEDMAAAVADLANLAENQIIATHDTGSELSAPVDTVQSGNMHAVTSSAVSEALEWKKILYATLSDISNILIPDENWQEMQIYFGTPFYGFTNVINRKIVTDRKTFVFYNSYNGITQVAGGRITIANDYKSLNLDLTICRENDATSSTGNIGIYYR